MLEGDNIMNWTVMLMGPVRDAKGPCGPAPAPVLPATGPARGLGVKRMRTA